jgi:TonB-linked SusC/RagA family outer membrane protein
VARPIPRAVRQGTVTGQVTELETQRPLDGAQVQIVGTNLSTLTDTEGRFRIQNVPAGEVEVQVRRLGYAAGAQRVVVAAGATVTVDFELEQDVLALDELVVTALGIERGARSLTYSTQSINTAPLTEARELNVINSLQGKVAGLSINQSATGVGGHSRVILRGNRSITGSSEPLYVLDGVPISGGIRDINPDDIATVDVLKGPNAAALYGAAAQNGAIVMTTHRGVADAIQFSVNQTFMLENPILADNYQNVYGQGTGGSYNPNSEFSWGPRMEGQMVDYWTFGDSDLLQGQQYSFLPQPNNIRDAFRTGYNSATNVTASIGRDETQAYVSFTYTDAEGMVPGNELTRSNLSVSVRSTVMDRLSLDGRLSYMRQSIENQLATGENFTNPLRHIYRLPRNIRTEDIKPFEYDNIDGRSRQNYFNVGSNGGANPYWTLNRNLNQLLRNRVLAMGSLTYSFTDELRLMARASYDASTDGTETRLYNDTYVTAPFGRYELRKDEGTQFNGDVLLSYARSVGVDWSFDTNLGGNVQQRRNTWMRSNTGTALIVPNFFTLSNTLNPTAEHNVGQPVDVHSLYAFAQIGWRHAVYLDISGRNDWSSTLPADNRSYFYPSVGLSTVLSDLVSLPEPQPLEEGNHRSYAVQWFLFAAIAAAGYPLLLRRRTRPPG